jgi:hypothetical protein
MLQLPTSRFSASFDAYANDVANLLCDEAGHRHARLPQGLEIVMQRAPESCSRRRWRLAIAREQHFPSADEADACCLAFKVPSSATQRRMVRTRLHPRSGRRIRYHVIEFTWQEMDTLA